MLETLAGLARTRWVQVAVALVVAVAVLGPRLTGSGSGDSVSTTTVPAATTAVSTSAAPGAEGATTSSPAATGSTFEVDRPGDQGNAGSLYPDRADRRPDDQERTVGGDPARISGFSGWVTGLEFADTYDEGDQEVPGPWVRVVVRLVNRDDVAQPASFDEWRLVGPDGVEATADFASQDLFEKRSMGPNTETLGELWFRTRGPGAHWLVWRPQSDEARGVWAVPVAA